ncbi:Smr/MutS family protein [Achromobacter sp. AONIH1]|uniref:Smr/MutS family protein n=1 Tax=unclassified Achromobacter TaxID=2626865 RepID=UPI000CD193E1|nr:Smr/MutS family protein [Achromobacter sp. AONIH1]AUT46536.1 DNA mismatch repair protein MutS [Achromobacter sp. AONIH1]
MKGSKVGLADLKRLKKDLEAERQRATLARASAAAAARKPAAESANPADDAEALRRSLRSVTPIRRDARVEHKPVATPAPALRRANALGETPTRADAGVSDGGEVIHLLSEGGTAFVRGDAAPDTARNLRRGQWRAGAELDLHGLRVEQARHALLSFLDECQEHGIRCVRIVHGKGYGSQGLEPVLKDKARTWLVQKNEVLAFSEAPEREGGAGALLVLLRQAEGARK